MGEPCSYCLVRPPVGATPDGDSICDDCADPVPNRAWCHTRHICHHWWEDECSPACDRGEHDHALNFPQCADRG